MKTANPWPREMAVLEPGDGMGGLPPAHPTFGNSDGLSVGSAWAPKIPRPQAREPELMDKSADGRVKLSCYRMDDEEARIFVVTNGRLVVGRFADIANAHRAFNGELQ